MNGPRKHSRDQGRPIGLKKAKRHENNWKKNPKNKQYKIETFTVPHDILTNYMKNPNCAGVRFCHGMKTDGSYSPVICTVTEDGEIIDTFNSKDSVSREEFDLARINWQSKFPLRDGHPQFFFLGEKAIKQNIEDFEIGKYEAVFVENDLGLDSGLLFGHTIDEMKDPGDGQPETVLNYSTYCPPFCLPDDGDV